MSKEGCQASNCANPEFAVSFWMPLFNEYTTNFAVLVYRWGGMEVTLLPSRACNLATLSRAKQEASESIANIRACFRHINREVILSEPQAGEVAQHLQVAEQSLQKAQALLSTQFNAVAEQLRDAQMAFLMGRQHSCRGLSGSSDVAESQPPYLSSIPLVEGPACDTVKGAVDDGTPMKAQLYEKAWEVVLLLTELGCYLGLRRFLRIWQGGWSRPYLVMLAWGLALDDVWASGPPCLRVRAEAAGRA